jgi:hypothetical protein
MDLSRFHHVINARHMDSASFFAAAARLPWVDGAVRRVLVDEIERRNSRPGRVAALTELTSRSDVQPRDGWGPVFEITRVPKAS